MTRTLAILGAGPIGLEAAALAALKGFDVTVYERGQIASNVARWGHVTLFSPWSLNQSLWGRELVESQEASEQRPEHVYPTGAEYIARYLRPLADHALISERIQTQTTVLGVSRTHALKGDFIARPERAGAPFILHVRDERGEERYDQADVVIDTTGAYDEPNALGPGGLSALGESRHGGRIERYVPDIEEEKETYQGRHTLVVGSGYSAITSIAQLRALGRDDDSTRVSWLMRSEQAPYELIEGDPLPQRASLAELGNRAAQGEIEGVAPLLGDYIERIETRDDALLVTIRHECSSRTIEVDRVIANVGYRPDTSLYRELQIHLCYASEGPMKLAASLLSGDAGADCLAQTSAGVETLMSPEPDFYILGAKSYGRNSSFLIKLGITQIEEVIGHLTQNG